jgi:hypothetical protein
MLLPIKDCDLTALVVNFYTYDKYEYNKEMQSQAAWRRRPMKAFGKGVIWFAVLASLTTLAVLIRLQEWYTPATDVGYYLGVVGGVLMLLLLIYSLKKRIRAFRRWGATKPWFIFHMICGIVGPIAIIFHSAFRINSHNAMVAMVSMLLVAGSGIVGRYLYVRIHDGHSDHELKLEALEGEESGRKLNITRDLEWAPNVLKELAYFRAKAKEYESGGLRQSISALGLLWLEWRIRLRCHQMLRAPLNERAAERKWDAEKIVQRRQQFDALIHRYTSTVKRSAQLATFKRLFALWHVLHLPFVYLLAGSAVYHVVAVHMY